MKQKDIVIIIVIVFIAGLASFFVSKKIFISEKDAKQEVKKVENISTQFETPDKAYYSDKSINPTQIINIGGGQQQPPPTN